MLKVFKCGAGEDHLDRLRKKWRSFTQSQSGKKTYIQKTKVG